MAEAAAAKNESARGRIDRKRHDRAHRRSRRIWALAVAAVVIAAIAVGVQRSRHVEPVAVTVVPVERGRVRDFVTSVAAGRVSGKEEATIRAELAGTVKEVPVDRGARIRAGDVLLRYDADDLRDRLRLAGSAIEVARAQVAQAKQNAANAEVEAARARTLRKSGAIADAELERLEGVAKASMRAVTAAQAGVQQASMNAELAKNGVDKTTVRAPLSGIVLERHIDPGESTTPAAPLFELADDSALHVDVEVDEADIGRIKVGMPAELSLDAFPGERFHGRVAERAPSVTRDPRGGRSLALDISLAADPRLVIGMSADVDIIVAVEKSALNVPPNAVLGRGAERVVFVVEGDVVRERKVEVGISTWEAVEVRKGLAEGDRIVTSLAATKVEDGMRVRATEARSIK